MYFTPCLTAIGLLLGAAVFATPTDISQEAPDAPSLVLPEPHPSLVDWREFLDGPRPGRHPESHRSYWTYLDQRTVREISWEDDARRTLLTMGPFAPPLQDVLDLLPKKACLMEWRAEKQMCYERLKEKVRVKDVDRAAKFDRFWDAVAECMRRASSYSCSPGRFPATSKSFLNICTKQPRSLLPRSLVNPVPGSRFRPKWSSPPLAAVASEAKAISVPESAVSQPASRSQALRHHVGTAVQAFVGKSYHAMDRIWKARPALSPLLNRLAHAHAPAPAVPLNAFEY
ncbi:MAG: hypothetical protein M1826_003657 [Phylliscum demangeonii]|nr:MAG: hypothetical protein M1826_003657 [Phylliscum demangeonii]